MNLQKEKNHLTMKELRSFGLIMGALFPLIFGIIIPWKFEYAWPLWPWILSGFFSINAIFLPQALKPIYKIWIKLGDFLGWINTRVILGIMLYAVFTPVGLILKLLGKDPMARKFQPQLKSYRIKPDSNENNSMENPF